VSLRSLKLVLRESPGSYIDGMWAGGVRSVLYTLASVQPVTIGRDMQSLPDGRRSSDFVKIYTIDRLNAIGDGDGIQPDIIVHNGVGYEIVSVDANQSGVINHYKYIASKLFRFTTADDWMNGSLTRN